MSLYAIDSHEEKVQRMNELSKMKEEELRLIQNLAELQTSLRKQQQSVKNAKAIYQRYSSILPLTAKKQSSTQHNAALEKKTLINCGADFFSALSILFFLGACAAVFALVFIIPILIPIVSPLLALIPFVFMLIGIGGVIAGQVFKCVYFVYEFLTNNDVRENKGKIVNNDEQMEQHTDEMSTLYDVTIPELQSDIDRTQASIENTEAQLESNQQQMQFQFSKTERTTPTQQSRSGFFSTTMIEAAEPRMMGPLNFGEVSVTGNLYTPR